jgi:hypothetical protein
MINKKYILLIFIFLIIFVLFKYNEYEYYDGIVKNIESIEDCADITSSIYDVSAFSYNPNDKTCFPSKTLLTRPPIQVHPYHNNFKLDDIICNKTLYAKNPEMNYDQILIGNRLYQCYNNTSKIDDDYDLYYFQKNKQKQLITYQDIGKLSITKHNFFNIDWPTNKDELNDIVVKMHKIKPEIQPKTIIDSITWEPKIQRVYTEEKIDYGYEYVYPNLGCIN